MPTIIIPIVREDHLPDAAREGAGAVVTFDGVVRAKSNGRQVTGIYYECYREMSERELADITLEAPDGIRIVSPALRMDTAGEIEWKIAADRCGTRALSIITPDGTINKVVVVGEDLGTVRFASLRPRAGTWSAFLYPAEQPISRDSIVHSITVHYEEKQGLLFGLTFHWLWIFFGISVIAGFALKDLFGIEV